ncbi:ABC transporter permease [Shinella sp. BYT-45]|uniref:ABC transporter permease n=1 Tax=Shinella sp. BYT-45 TaxID=3377377 RepID=UPI003980C476
MLVRTRTDRPVLKREAEPTIFRTYAKMLWRDKLAFASAIFVLLAVLAAVAAPIFLERQATAMNLLMRNAAPFNPDNGLWYMLGGDTLGRSVLARILVAARNTLLVAASAVFISLLVGSALGLVAGWRPGWLPTIIMRAADVLMSFPSLLLAVIVLYAFTPGLVSVVAVLAITRLPIYIRTVRAEVLEIRERVFVTSSRVLGAGFGWIVTRHILPVVTPTIITIATLEFAFVMLTEASLSFLGLGIQPPQVSWGLMVAEGRNYLSSAWWIAFWPGLAIMLTTVSLNLLSNWLRIATDPRQRWRLEMGDDR